MKQEQIEEIHESLINGQRKQMTSQIDEYGLYDFFADYDNYLREAFGPQTAYNYFSDAVISYHHNKNR